MLAKVVTKGILFQMTDDFRKLYKDNVVVEVLTVNPEQGGYVRRTRSLMAVDVSKQSRGDM
jgi:hypothetical protein